MNFILQTVNGGMVTLDMCFQLERAEEYWRWRNPNDTFKYIYAELEDFGVDNFSTIYDMEFNPEEWCPVGTVEFVEKYLRTYFGNEVADNAMIPVNIPLSVGMCDTSIFGRNIGNITVGTLETKDEEYFANHKEYYDNKFFVKDAERIKNPKNGIMTLYDAMHTFKRFQYSDILSGDNEIVSEWRTFLHNGKLIDIKNYSGDPFTFPRTIDLDNMVKTIGNMYPESTMDVAVTKNGTTILIEIHKFFSCGLYGFNQLDVLPIMYWRTYMALIGGTNKK